MMLFAARQCVDVSEDLNSSTIGEWNERRVDGLQIGRNDVCPDCDGNLAVCFSRASLVAGDVYKVPLRSNE